MDSFAEQLETLLPLVSKPSRYLGNEFHVVRKTPRKGMVQWCLILPEVYEIGMSHWGLKILYEILNRREDTLAERCFSPWFDMEDQLRQNGLPLFALESKRPLHQFDIVGFSLQYELTYTNILQCLDLGKIPLRTEERKRGDPLVIAGGPCASNPEPLSDFIDIFLIGDGEEAIDRITDAYQELRDRPRDEILREMAKVPGLYVPSMYESIYDSRGRLLETRPRHDDVPRRVSRQFITELESAPIPDPPIVPLQGIVQDRLTVEVLRGCTQGCRFCQAGYLYRPIRERSAGKILEIADQGIRSSGWEDIGLTSLSTADHTQLESIVEVLNVRFRNDRVGISLPSLRADSFGVEVAERVKETRRSGFTFAPEVGSERLRLAVNKLIRDDEFFKAAEIAYERGWRLIKMYFMVGLPTETWDDVDGIVKFIGNVREIGRRHGPANTVNASIGAFVPKSHTPFQWDAFEPIDLLREKIDHVRRKASSRWSRVKWHDVKASHLEACFSMGDRRLGPAIEWAYRNGARFDGWTEHFNHDLWMRAFEESGIDPAEQTRKRGFDEALPWDPIDIGVLKKWLVRQREKTDEGLFEVGKSLTPDCRHGDCSACGIPGLPNDTRLAAPLTPPETTNLLERAAQGAPRREDVAVSWPTRIAFEKLGPARFLSHLELGTVLARAFRMARVPLAHSRGHVARPKLHFGPSLPVGIEGRAEAFDAEILQPWSPSLADRLNRVLPEGIRIVEGAHVLVVPGVRKLSLAQKAARADYQVDLTALPADRRSSIGEKLTEFADLDECVVDRASWSPTSSREATDWDAPMDRSESGEKETASSGEETSRAPRKKSPDSGSRDRKATRSVDLKLAIHAMSLDSEKDRLSLDLYLSRPDGQVANPKVILERLFCCSPQEQAQARIVRISLLTKDGRRVVGSNGAGDLTPVPIPPRSG